MLIEEFMEPIGITQTELAEKTGLPREHVNELCRNRRTVTADTALILGRVSMSRSLMSSGFVFVFSFIASLPLLLFVVG